MFRSSNQHQLARDEEWGARGEGKDKEDKGDKGDKGDKEVTPIQNKI